MLSRGNLKRTVVAVAAGLLIGGTVTAVTPAGAEVSQFAATNWKKIWKKKLAPQADKRYYKKADSDAKYAATGSTYTKAQSDAALGNYYTKAQSDTALGNYYTKAQSDGAFQPKGSYAPAGSSYTKAESDAKYAPYPALIRGTYFMTTTGAAGAQVGASISYGYTVPVAPIVHYIASGAVPPAGCSGTVEAPDATVGHLCVFEQLDNNASGQQIYNASGSAALSSRMGVLLNASATAAGSVYVYGSWAMRPATVSGTGAKSTTPSATGPSTLGR